MLNIKHFLLNCSKEIVKIVVGKANRIFMKNNVTKTENKGVMKHLIITVAAGAVFWMIGEWLFPALTDKMWTPLGIALYFLIFSVLLMIVFFVISINKVDASKAENKKNIKESFMVGIIFVLILLLLSGLFEFLYELGGKDVIEPTSYIFLIDDSGSMSGTESIRVNAIKEVMENSGSDKPYAVYKFSDSAEMLKPMGNYNSDDINDFVFSSDSGTEILGSIETVLDDLNNGSLVNAGSAPKILLVSDGASSSLGMKNVINRCKHNHVSVSTIGVEGCSKSFLKRIADGTGGVFVECDDVSKLSESLEKAKVMNTDRNLLSERFVYSNDALYAFLRILFLGLIGIVWTATKYFFASNDARQTKKMVALSIVCCTAGVLILEFLSRTSVDIRFVRLLFCVLWAVTYGVAGTRIAKSNPEYCVIEGVPTSITGTPVGNETGLNKDDQASDKSKSIFWNDPESESQNKHKPPFQNQPFGPFSGGSSGNSGGFKPDVFGENKPSSPFDDGSSNPLGGDSPKNPFN